MLVGVACWAPIAPTALAPISPLAPSEAAAPLGAGRGGPGGQVAAAGGIPGLGVAAVPTLPARAGATPTAAPRVAPTPFVVPTVSPTGRALLAAVKSDRLAQWVKNHTETPLRSGPEDSSMVFTRLPQWSTLKQIESRPNWLLVEYGGDGATRQAGPGWVKAGDVGAIDPPVIWLSSARSGSVWSTADASAQRIVDVPSTVLMEAIGPEYVAGTRLHVQLPGDGRTVPPTQGWVDADVLTRTRTPSPFDLPWAYPENLRADVRLNVPYRTQLDGSDYASANCGPTVLGMALESFGMNPAPPDLRGQVLRSEEFDPTDTDAGSYIWALANVARDHGLKTHGLYESDGESLHRWTADEIRDAVRAKQPVIVQVYYRALPGREDSGYYGDHYIIITGLLGDNFLYNDPIGGSAAREGPGYDRLMSSTQLRRAMRASDTGYQFSAFGVARS
ncbi:MAG TPA: C39 family peptidase [Chloroflexota bacterium]